MQQFRQGDVFLTPVKRRSRSKRVRRVAGRIVLALGEVTGHAHAIADREAELWEAENGRRFLKVLADAGVDLVHEEHAPITIPPGTYDVTIQREYAPEAPRFVSD